MFKKKKIDKKRDFPGDPVVKTLYFHCSGMGSIPDQGTRMPQGMVKNKKKTINVHIFATAIPAAGVFPKKTHTSTKMLTAVLFK